MVDKKGYIRTIEAIIAIVIILIVIFTLIPKKIEKSAKVPSIVEASQNFILNEIAFNDTIRECIVNNTECENSSILTSIIEKNIPAGYEIAYRICDTSNCVINTPVDKDVFVNDIFVASTLETQNPKIVRLWTWRKS